MDTKPDILSRSLRTDFNGAHSDLVIDLIDAPAAPQLDATPINIFNNISGADAVNARALAETSGANMGPLSFSASGASQSADAAAKDKQEKEAKRRLEDALFRSLMDQIAECDRQMAEAAEKLHEKYGEDIVGGMAATYLTEEQLATLHTDEERLEALSKVFLDDDGKIKPEYADSPEAEYLKAWKDKQELEAGAKNYPNMSRPEQEAFEAKIESTDALDVTKQGLLLEQHVQVAEVAEKTVDQAAESDTASSNPNGFNFG